MDNFTLASTDSNGSSSLAEAMGTRSIAEGYEDQTGTYMSDDKELQMYLRITCLVFIFIIFTVGTVGNVMVTMVISFSRDMR